MNAHTTQKGFTLAELLVVVAIIGVILAITVTGQNKFGSTALLTSTAYDMALSVRQAQVYGVSGRSGTSAGYGVDFQMSAPTTYRLFLDSYPASVTACHPANPNEPSDTPSTKTGDCVYTTSDSVVGEAQINNGIAITDFCTYKSGASSCASGGTISQLDISFVRPSPEAVIYAKGSGTVSDADAACVKIEKSGGVRYLLVRKIGTISVLQVPGSSCSGL
ncbi:MAG TPA: prepilin-type N-terminal cleavage/methylation domain-containing protein [Candidatus Paceibacterota bacterium]